MTIHITKPEHEVAYQDLVTLLAKHQHLSPAELLAIAGNMVGKIIAMQDQRVITTDMAIQIVAKNIESGNAQMVQELIRQKGSA